MEERILKWILNEINISLNKKISIDEITEYKNIDVMKKANFIGKTLKEKYNLTCYIVPYYNEGQKVVMRFKYNDIKYINFVFELSTIGPFIYSFCYNIKTERFLNCDNFQAKYKDILNYFVLNNFILLNDEIIFKPVPETTHIMPMDRRDLPIYFFLFHDFTIPPQDYYTPF